VSAHDPDRDLDELLRDDAGRLGSLYRKLPRYEPPRRLDRAVLGEAARAVHSGKPPRRQRWLVGVGSAAGLVLAAGIAWRIGHDAMNEGAVPPAAAPTVVPVQPIDGSAHAKREQSAPEAATADALSSPAPAAQNAAAARPAERDAVKQDERKLRAAAKSAAPAPKPVAAPAPEPFPAQPRQREEAPAKDLEKLQSFEESQPATAGRATGAMGGAAAGAVAPSSDKKTAAPERAYAPASPTVPSGSVELRRDMQLPPGEWLAHIRELERQGRHQQAMESLRLFIRAHPNRKVPTDLQPLLD
jgi:hypothetical protein